MESKVANRLFKAYRFLKKKEIGEVKAGSGWDGLITEMCSNLSTLELPMDFVVTHISNRHEKLEVHTSKGNNQTRSVIMAAQEIAEDTCDACGNLIELDMCPKCKGVPVRELTPDEIVVLMETKIELVEPCKCGKEGCDGNCGV